MQRVVIIGGGFGGLAAACLLGRAGYQVTVLEKNEQLGGRIGQRKAKGFTFDTGPSWYLMPDVFEHFFELLGEQPADYFILKKLSPSYRVTFRGSGEQLDITGNLELDAATFDHLEPGAGQQLRRYLAQAARTYHLATDRFLYKNYSSARDLLVPELLRTALKPSFSGSLHRYVGHFFKDERLQKLVEYPMVFLGATPYRAPALYSLMSHLDHTQGVFYPQGGMYGLVEALVAIGKKYGVSYRTSSAASQIIVQNGAATGVAVHGKTLPADLVISNADRHFSETVLLQPHERDHTPRYWRSRTVAPSALLMYLGVGRRYPNLAHHNLLLGGNWRQNFAELYKHDSFPASPSLYVCAPSKTDASVAPKGCENLFVLVPVSAGLRYSPAELTAFARRVLSTVETELHLPGLQKQLRYQELFCVDDFARRFNSFQGSGLGLAHTLRQTALLRPRNFSKKVRGLYYVGADTQPGIGLPMALISAELLAKRLT